MYGTSLLNELLEKIAPAQKAYAHCDIPCGIYDPHQAQIAALSVVRMVQLIEGLENTTSTENQNKLSRFIAAKEESAEQAKKELRILWGDYFKPEHVSEYPNLHDMFFTAMKQGSQVRQTASMEAAQGFLATVQEISEIFWKTKGETPSRQPSRQAVGGEIVYPS
jgi:nickel superoxide dismutase